MDALLSASLSVRHLHAAFILYNNLISQEGESGAWRGLTSSKERRDDLSLGLFDLKAHVLTKSV